MLTKEEYDTLRGKSKEFFTDEDGDQVRIDEDMVSMLLDHLEKMRPGDGDTGRKKALSRVLLEKARELLEHHDSVAVYAIQQFADNPMMLKLFLRYRLRIDDERRRIRKRRESMAQISSVFKVNKPLTTPTKLLKSSSSHHSNEIQSTSEGDMHNNSANIEDLPAGFKASPPRMDPSTSDSEQKLLNEGTRRAVAELLGLDIGENKARVEVQKESKWHAIVRSRLSEISASYDKPEA